MNRVTTLSLTTTTLLCLAVSFTGDPAARLLRGGTGAGNAALAQGSPPSFRPLLLNDVSWLFPAPKRLDDVISMGDLTTPNAADPTKRDPIWPHQAFRQ